MSGAARPIHVQPFLAIPSTSSGILRLPLTLITDIEYQERLAKRSAGTLPILVGPSTCLPCSPRLAVRPKIASSGNLGDEWRSRVAL
ncbi:hypothetical protein CTAM01_17045 [Colletotrichum tamarilloi]|uniref:Uncharacterized protein n=1 Tax=Colletotrichum tamarilloi TaxID=1209934 RepID=A0ABQ9QGS3_9PEZI|nr:uncharacterized protein CTAM01_17045 [Colletotrichum tamarilloi]KAK1466150.1 hypothetical protein CTAM01_17045 [Colletotrichum tamarilloi]